MWLHTQQEHQTIDITIMIKQCNFTHSDEDASDEESGHTEDGEDAEERPKVKRTRTAYSNYQLDQLELVFSQTHYPDVFLREELSARLGISESRLQVNDYNQRSMNNS